jgi:heptosyltransferase-1
MRVLPTTRATILHKLSAPRILLVKTSSLGDVIHNLPVVSDIVRHFPDAQIDWLAEESFAALPRLHPGVRKVIPVAVRRWRRTLLQSSTWQEVRAFRRKVAAEKYDWVIDTQGLLKSALLMSHAQGVRCGFDRDSAREPLAALFYQRTFAVAREQHAVERNRQLAALVLGYALSGIQPSQLPRPAWLAEGRYAVLLHATSRDDKLWDEANWVALGKHFQQQGIRSILPWGGTDEQSRAARLSAQISDAVCPPKLNLNEIAALLDSAHAVIGVDTGIAHLAAALNKPTIGIYTATDPALTGLYAGALTTNLGGVKKSPTVDEVISALTKLIA